MKKSVLATVIIALAMIVGLSSCNSDSNPWDFGNLGGSSGGNTGGNTGGNGSGTGAVFLFHSAQWCPAFTKMSPLWSFFGF